MNTQALTADTPTFHASPPPRPVNRRDRGEDAARHLSRLMSLARERTRVTRVPALDWPVDLFADVAPEIAE